MQTIEATVNVSEDRKLTIQLPTSIPMGEYEVVLVLNNRVAQTVEKPSIEAAQALLRQFVPEGRSLSTELIQQRREEGLNE